MDEWLSRKQVCQLLAISPTTLSRWEADPNMDFPRHFHVGGKNLAWRKAFYQKEQVFGWMADQVKYH